MSQATQADPRRPNRPSPGSPADAVLSTIGWVRRAVAWDRATVQILLPDAAGRLRVFAADGEPIHAGRLRSGRRRQVYASGVPMRIALRRPTGCSLAIHPLSVDDRTVGLLELVAPTEQLDRRAEIVETAVGQAAVVLRSLQEQHESDAALRSMGAELRLAADLLRAETPASAVRSAVGLCAERLNVPVAGLLPDRSGTGWFVAAAHGLGASRRAAFRRSIDEVSVLPTAPNRREQLVERFASVLSREDASSVEAGEATLLIAGRAIAEGEFVQTVAMLLGEALERIGSLGWAELRNESLDLAIAWTAHELRGPLVGARAALDRVAIADADPGDKELLRRTKDELGQLADLVDPLLRWSAGSQDLQMRRADLVRIVREAVRTCCFEFPEGSHIEVEAPDATAVRADSRELRGAVANVVRNALQHSPHSRPITVRVEEEEGVARVLVRDRGPGVPARERHLIFDPFARGRTADARRSGKGLGLFIARRVVEAHGGTIGVRPIRPGAEFCIELPLLEGGHASAS